MKRRGQKVVPIQRAAQQTAIADGAQCLRDVFDWLCKLEDEELLRAWDFILTREMNRTMKGRR